MSGLCGTAGCLVDDAETPAAGATGATGATGGSSGSSGTGGSAGSATTDMCVVGAPANQCAKAGVPVDGVVVDFATFMAPAGTWGVSSVGDLTGGTSLYSG